MGSCLAELSCFNHNLELAHLVVEVLLGASVPGFVWNPVGISTVYDLRVSVAVTKPGAGFVVG